RGPPGPGGAALSHGPPPPGRSSRPDLRRDGGAARLDPREVDHRGRGPAAPPPGPRKVRRAVARRGRPIARRSFLGTDRGGADRARPAALLQVGAPSPPVAAVGLIGSSTEEVDPARDVLERVDPGGRERRGAVPLEDAE